MIAGSINFSRQATIPVAMMNNNNRQYAQIHSIIDTGFDGDLQLPSQ
jgi:predicted aspartyl protease